MVELDNLWARQADFNRKFVNLGHLTQEQKEAFTKDYILYLHGELTELAQNMNWKRHRRENLQVIQSNIYEEIIDCFKYLNSIMLLWDMTPEKFLKEWERKTQVVEQRYAQEFSNRYDPAKYKYCAVVDIDGVLADYLTGFYRFISSPLLKPFRSADEVHSDLVTVFGQDGAQELKHAYRLSGAKATLPLIPGAKEFMDFLREDGAFILIMSSRPYKQYKRIMADTLQWLKNNRIPYDSILWDENKEDRIVKEYPNARFVVEDSKKNALRIAEKGIPVFLRSKSAYLTSDPIHVFQDFQTIIQAIKEGKWESSPV